MSPLTGRNLVDSHGVLMPEYKIYTFILLELKHNNG